MLDYKKYILDKRIENFNQLKNEIKNVNSFKDLPKELKHKIKNYLIKFNGLFDEKSFFEALKENDFLLSFFVKEPLKQTTHQNVAFEYLKENLPNFQLEMPDNKKYYLTDLGVFTKDKMNGILNKSKSIDFIIEDQDRIYLCTHKYIGKGGGGQDNQFYDVISFLENCPKQHFKFRNKTAFVVAITDGEYFNKKSHILKDKYLNYQYLIGNIDEIIFLITHHKKYF